MNLYIGDLHFGHKNVIMYDQRPFASVEEMDAVLIELWNSRVRKDDHVYILGDLCYKNKRPEEWYLKQLYGHKHLIMGNHDKHLLRNENAMKYLESVDQLLFLNDGGKQIQLCHYPLAEWNHFHRGSYLIYGHIHNRTDGTFQYMKTLNRALNAGCMINNFTPASLKELIQNNQAFKEAAEKVTNAANAEMWAMDEEEE